MAISASKAKAVCNKSELALVNASGKSQIGGLTQAQLLQKIARARKLRDKWRDQAARQRRDQQGRPNTGLTQANARTTEKAQLFAEVLERFEAQLGKMGGDRAGGAGGRPRATRKLRSRLHRAERAEVREELDQTRRELAAANKTPAKSGGATDRSKAKSASDKSAGDERTLAATPVKTKGKSRTSSPERVAVFPAAPAKKPRASRPASRVAVAELTEPAAVPGLRITKRQQLKVATKAKQNRLQAAGVVRVQKHASARTKRRQARRDSR
jgi:hypothetical protein